MKLHGLERKGDLQKLQREVKKTTEKVLDVYMDVTRLAMSFKTNNMKETLLNKAKTIEKIGMYLYDVNIRINSHLKKHYTKKKK